MYPIIWTNFIYILVSTVEITHSVASHFRYSLISYCYNRSNIRGTEQRPRGHGDIRISDYYNKKHSDEKLHHYAATIACCNKLLRQFYYRSRDLTKTKELIIK